LARESASRLNTESARVSPSWKVPSRPPGRVRDYTCTGRTTKRYTSSTARLPSRWMERNTFARPGHLSMSQEAPAMVSLIHRLIPSGSWLWLHRRLFAWSKNSSNWSGRDELELKQVSTMRQSIPRPSRPCMRGTTASWSRAEELRCWTVGIATAPNWMSARPGRSGAAGPPSHALSLGSTFGSHRTPTFSKEPPCPLRAPAAGEPRSKEDVRGQWNATTKIRGNKR
jgi:hypothetical protein